jgi:hypothetical protein
LREGLAGHTGGASTNHSSNEWLAPAKGIRQVANPSTTNPQPLGAFEALSLLVVSINSAPVALSSSEFKLKSGTGYHDKCCCRASGGPCGNFDNKKFSLDPNGRFSEPGWWIEKDGNKGPESPIGADLFYILESLLILAEEIVVLWGADNLRFRQAQRIAFLPEERRDRDNPIQYVVTASREFEQSSPILSRLRGSGRRRLKRAVSTGADRGCSEKQATIKRHPAQ